MASLARLITRPTLENLGGDRSFQRGLTYFREGAVERLIVHGDRISARVVGTEIYTVRLWPDRGGLRWNCSCPMGDDGAFCKHLVATGLAWLDNGGHGDAQSSSEVEAIRKFLQASDKPALVSLLIERACEDEELSDRLLVAAQRQGMSNPDAVRSAIHKSFPAGAFIDYQRMPQFVRRAMPVADLLEDILKQGDARLAAQLCAEAMTRGLKTLAQSDDSDGRLGELLGRIAATHRAAVGKADLPPAELARQLLDLQLADDFDFFILEGYRKALGKKGIAAYRERASAAWNKLKPMRPGSSDNREMRADRLSAIMQTLARMDDDADALVDVLKRDLTHSYAYLEIAQTLAKAKRHDEALQWAEAGRKAFAHRLDYMLDEFLVSEYHRRKRHDDAIHLRWDRYLETPSLRAYQELKTSADRAGSWLQWRAQALTMLSQQRQSPKSTGRLLPAWKPNGSALVEILLWERTPLAALEAARSAGCSDHLWIAIAGALEGDHPEKAIGIYRERIDPIVQRTDKQAYDYAVELLRRVRRLMMRTGENAAFDGYVEDLHKRYKAKRTFVQKLERLARQPVNGGTQST